MTLLVLLPVLGLVAVFGLVAILRPGSGGDREVGITFGWSGHRRDGDGCGDSGGDGGGD